MLMQTIREDRIDKAIKRNGAFFAFNNEQFERKALKCMKYVSMGAGLICPKGRQLELEKDIDIAIKENRQDDLNANSKKEIIWRELANHEAQITYSIEQTVEALTDYDITRNEIQAEFKDYMNHCIENDLF